MEMPAKPLFNPDGDTDVRSRRMIGGNTTNLNDFNNMRYSWVSGWYRQAMNNFWIGGDQPGAGREGLPRAWTRPGTA